MLRVAGRRLSSLLWRSLQTASAFSHRIYLVCSDGKYADDSASSRSILTPYLFSFTPDIIRGFSSEALAPGHDLGMISDLPATVAAVKNPTSKIVYDEQNHERFPPGDPSKRAFAYFVLTGGSASGSSGIWTQDCSC